MPEATKYISYGLIGAGVGYAFYKFTQPRAAPVEEREYILVKIPVPKAAGESALRTIVEKAKPSKVTPSFSPIGATLEWTPIVVDTFIGPISFSPPKKFVSLNDVAEVYRIIREMEPQVVDRGAYWEVIVKIKT